jgi:hypothetical protein
MEGIERSSIVHTQKVTGSSAAAPTIKSWNRSCPRVHQVPPRKSWAWNPVADLAACGVANRPDFPTQQHLENAPDQG